LGKKGGKKQRTKFSFFWNVVPRGGGGLSGGEIERKGREGTWGRGELGKSVFLGGGCGSWDLGEVTFEAEIGGGKKWWGGGGGGLLS